MGNKVLHLIEWIVGGVRAAKGDERWWRGMTYLTDAERAQLEGDLLFRRTQRRREVLAVLGTICLPTVFDPPPLRAHRRRVYRRALRELEALDPLLVYRASRYTSWIDAQAFLTGIFVSDAEASNTSGLS